MFKKIAAIILVLAVASFLVAFSLPQNKFDFKSGVSHAEFKARPPGLSPKPYPQEAITQYCTINGATSDPSACPYDFSMESGSAMAAPATTPSAAKKYLEIAFADTSPYGAYKSGLAFDFSRLLDTVPRFDSGSAMGACTPGCKANGAWAVWMQGGLCYRSTNFAMDYARAACNFDTLKFDFGLLNLDLGGGTNKLNSKSGLSVKSG